VPEDYSTSSDGQLQLLDAIVCGCMEHVPFQNLTMLTRFKLKNEGTAHHQQHCPPTLGQIINDMVHGLGGLCTTRNPFLFLLLKALGFESLRFVSATMTSADGSQLAHAHIALLVSVGSRDYWVDVANGFPYMKPLVLDKESVEVIEHPFVDTRLVKKNEVWVVQHRFHSPDLPRSDARWTDNYFFDSVPVEYITGFASMHEKHYDPRANFGPFLKHLRFNMWSKTSGFILRDDQVKAVHCSASPGRPCRPTVSKKINLWDETKQSSEFAMLAANCGFKVEQSLVELASEAWARCQVNNETVRSAEVLTVTGGFF